MQLPSAEAEPERYEQRPLLLVLENFILDCIGQLEQEKQKGMTDLVLKIFGGEGDWKATIRHILEFDDDIDEALREMWKKNLNTAAEENLTLHPVQFAKMCANENFAHFFDDSENTDDSHETD